MFSQDNNQIPDSSIQGALSSDEGTPIPPPGQPATPATSDNPTQSWGHPGAPITEASASPAPAVAPPLVVQPDTPIVGATGVSHEPTLPADTPLVQLPAAPVATADDDTAQVPQDLI